MINKLQILILSQPVKIAGGILFSILAAIVIDPIFGAIGLVILSAVLSMLATWYWFQRNQAIKERDTLAVAHQKLVDRVTEIEMQSHILAQAMLPVSAAFQAILVKELTHMHTPEMDGLMEKIGPPFTLTEAEANRLSALMEARTRDMSNEITPSERDAATMMPALMRRVRAESEAIRTAPAVPKLVSMTVVVEKPDGAREAMLIQTQPAVEYTEREVLSAALAENTRLTRETNEALKAKK